MSVTDLASTYHRHKLKLTALLQNRLVELTSWHDHSVELCYHADGLNVEFLEKVGYGAADLDDARLTICHNGDCAWIDGFVHKGFSAFCWVWGRRPQGSVGRGLAPFGVSPPSHLSLHRVLPPFLTAPSFT